MARFFEVRTTADAAGFAVHLQQALLKIDGNLLVESRPLADLVDQSLALQRLIARLTGLLFGLAANDPATISLATLLMVAVASLAAYFPARKASRVEPMVALKYE
jgi:ABC-type antimicrobial peptide transport system permease subunit